MVAKAVMLTHFEALRKRSFTRVRAASQGQGVPGNHVPDSYVNEAKEKKRYV